MVLLKTKKKNYILEFPLKKQCKKKFCFHFASVSTNIATGYADDHQSLSPTN